MKTITLRELQKMGRMTYSVKDASIRGVKTIDILDVKVGDELVLDNQFVKVIEGQEQSYESEKLIRAIDILDRKGIDKIYIYYNNELLLCGDLTEIVPVCGTDLFNKYCRVDGVYPYSEGLCADSFKGLYADIVLLEDEL